MTRRTALIVGITGQDGSYLCELLLNKGYVVYGVIRRSSSLNTRRIDHLYQDPQSPDKKLFLIYADVTDGASLREVIREAQPDEIYNLAAQSHVRVSFDMPVHTADIVGTGATRLLEAVREYKATSRRGIRYYQASSSEMFGQAEQSPQSELTPFRPRSPYAAAKLYAHWMTVNYREAYGIHASCGILYNHESPRRGETFVSRKITRAVGRIRQGLQSTLYLGNLDAQRDWGFAGDYVMAMWQMLQEDRADDYVIATGKAYSVREFVELAFGYAGLNWRDFVQIDPRYYRPTEVDTLLGDATKARHQLGWRPEVGFHDLVRMMVDADLELAAREKLLADAGHLPPIH